MTSPFPFQTVLPSVDIMISPKSDDHDAKAPLKLEMKGFVAIGFSLTKLNVYSLNIQLAVSYWANALVSIRKRNAKQIQ
jgi:hypothetical protein